MHGDMASEPDNSSTAAPAVQVVIAFRGTASLKNAREDLQVGAFAVWHCCTGIFLPARIACRCCCADEFPPLLPRRRSGARAFRKALAPRCCAREST